MLDNNKTLADDAGPGDVINATRHCTDMIGFEETRQMFGTFSAVMRKLGGREFDHKNRKKVELLTQIERKLQVDALSLTEKIYLTDANDKLSKRINQSRARQTTIIWDLGIILATFVQTMRTYHQFNAWVAKFKDERHKQAIQNFADQAGNQDFVGATVEEAQKIISASVKHYLPKIVSMITQIDIEQCEIWVHFIINNFPFLLLIALLLLRTLPYLGDKKRNFVIHGIHSSLIKTVLDLHAQHLDLGRKPLKF